MDIKRLLKLDLTYNSNAERHFVNCDNLLSNAKEFREVIYAALELRMCIERLCFEYFYLIIQKKRDLKRDELRLYRPKEIIAKITDEAPFFNKTIDFLNAIFICEKVNKRMVHPDFEWINKTFGVLSSYLHLQKEPLNDAEKGKLLVLLPEALPRIKSYIIDRGSILELVDHAQMIYDRYINGEIDHGQMLRMIELASIPKHLLNRFND